MKIFKTMITKQYVPEWSVVDGIREVLANSLDAPFPMEYEISGDTISITTVGCTLPISCLTMGTSSHRDDSDAIGTHGEGSLLSLAVVTREGYSITIQNGNKIWTPSFQYDEDLEVEILIIEETETTGQPDNYTVTIECTEEIIEEVVSRCLYLQDDIGEVSECKMGRLLHDVKYSGKLFVGGIYVSDISTHHYGYDFHPSYMPLNRDRATVEWSKLNENTSKLMIMAIGEEDIADNIVKGIQDTKYLEYYQSEVSEPVHDAVFDKFIDKHGEDAVACSIWNEDILKERGYENVVIVYDDCYRKTLENGCKYQEHINKLEETLEEPEEKDTRTPLEMLEGWYDTCCDHIRKEDEDRLLELIEAFKKRGVSWNA